MMLRKPMPVARSIHWVPAGSDGATAVSGADVPLFITQGALREAMRHLRSDPEQELMGFLLGNLFECPDTGSRYVVITSAMRTGHVIGEVEPMQIPEEEWLGMQLELRRMAEDSKRAQEMQAAELMAKLQAMLVDAKTRVEVAQINAGEAH